MDWGSTMSGKQVGQIRPRRMYTRAPSRLLCGQTAELDCGVLAWNGPPSRNACSYAVIFKCSAACSI